MHVPPFLQGELWHSLISTAQRGPVKPGRQLQWKEFTPSVHEPPLRQGSDGAAEERQTGGQHTHTCAHMNACM